MNSNHDLTEQEEKDFYKKEYEIDLDKKQFKLTFNFSEDAQIARHEEFKDEVSKMGLKYGFELH